VWVRSRLSLGISRLGRPFPSAKLAEELSQHRAAFFCHDPRHQLEAVVQLGVGAQVAHTSTESCFGVVRSVDTALDPRENHCAGAHRAWLQGDVDRAVFKAPVALCLCRCAHGAQLGMTAGIILRLSRVVGTRKHPSFGVYHDCAHWDFSQCGRMLR